MTKKSYGVSSFVHDGELYDVLNRDKSDLPFYKRRCAEASGAILELCCGTGRLTVPLAKYGFNITGLDIEPSMLDRAKTKATEAGLDISFIQSDMRSFKLSQHFKLIFIPFNSLQNTYSRQDVEKIFTTIKQHLAPGGYFVFDVFNPNFKLMVDRSGEAREQYRGVMPDGQELVVSERCAYDTAGQVNRVTWYYQHGERTWEAKLDMRCYYPLELEALLHYNGWRIEKHFGSFDEAPFCAESQKQIFICTPA